MTSRCYKAIALDFDGVLTESNDIKNKAFEHVFADFPEAEHIFQRTGPDGGFGGMVTKPWDERKRRTEQLQFEANQKISQIPGVQVFVTTPAPLPGGSGLFSNNPVGGRRLRDRVCGVVVGSGPR